MATEAIIHPPRTMLEIYAGLPEGTHVQLINNQIIMSPAPSDTHQKILGKIYKKLDDYCETLDLGEVRMAPYDVYLDAENAYQPDVILVLKANIYKMEERGLMGTPDIVVEVLSPASARYDKKEKKDVYEKAGVQEYFIIEPHEKRVWRYQLIDGLFHDMGQTTGILPSTLLATEISF